MRPPVVDVRGWARAHWWRPPLTGRLLAGRLFGHRPGNALRIVSWMAVGTAVAAGGIGGLVGSQVARGDARWEVALAAAITALVAAPVIWVLVCAAWVESGRDALDDRYAEGSALDAPAAAKFALVG